MPTLKSSRHSPQVSMLKAFLFLTNVGNGWLWQTHYLLYSIISCHFKIINAINPRCKFYVLWHNTFLWKRQNVQILKMKHFSKKYVFYLNSQATCMLNRLWNVSVFEKYLTIILWLYKQPGAPSERVSSNNFIFVVRLLNCNNDFKSFVLIHTVKNTKVVFEKAVVKVKILRINW